MKIFRLSPYFRCFYQSFFICLLVFFPNLRSEGNLALFQIMSSIHYKFKATLEYKTLVFDGLHISVNDLKKEICDKEHISVCFCYLFACFYISTSTLPDF